MSIKLDNLLNCMLYLIEQILVNTVYKTLSSALEELLPNALIQHCRSQSVIGHRVCCSYNEKIYLFIGTFETYTVSDG